MDIIDTESTTIILSDKQKQEISSELSRNELKEKDLILEEKLKKFRLIKKLGEGGCAKVYEARYDLEGWKDTIRKEKQEDISDRLEEYSTNIKTLKDKISALQELLNKEKDTGSADYARIETEIKLRQEEKKEKISQNDEILNNLEEEVEREFQEQVIEVKKRMIISMLGEREIFNHPHHSLKYMNIERKIFENIDKIDLEYKSFALKLFEHRGDPESEGFLRFASEAKHLLGVQGNEKIIPVYDTNYQDKQSTLSYYTMEVLPYTLEDLYEGKLKLTLGDSLSIIKDIAEALVTVHESGLTHRDLKERNIGIDHEKKGMLLDFGIAKDKRTVLTVVEGKMGTPSYFSPELARSAHEAGYASDIYQLGIILMNCITNAIPTYKRQERSSQKKGSLTKAYNLVSGSFKEIFKRKKITSEDVNRSIEEFIDLCKNNLSEDLIKDPELDIEYTPREINPKIDVHLESIILKCLEKDPFDRYRSAKDLTQDLDAYMNGIPPLANYGRFHERRRKRFFSRYKNTIRTAFSAAVLALTIGAANLAKDYTESWYYSFDHFISSKEDMPKKELPIFFKDLYKKTLDKKIDNMIKEKRFLDGKEFPCVAYKGQDKFTSAGRDHWTAHEWAALLWDAYDETKETRYLKAAEKNTLLPKDKITDIKKAIMHGRAGSNLIKAYNFTKNKDYLKKAEEFAEAISKNLFMEDKRFFYYPIARMNNSNMREEYINEDNYLASSTMYTLVPFLSEIAEKEKNQKIKNNKKTDDLLQKIYDHADSVDRFLIKRDDHGNIKKVITGAGIDYKKQKVIAERNSYVKDPRGTHSRTLAFMTYGFSRLSKKERYKKTAEELFDFYSSNVLRKGASSWVPAYDITLDENKEIKDSSAAALTALSLTYLYENDPKQKYKDAYFSIMKSLSFNFFNRKDSCNATLDQYCENIRKDKLKDASSMIGDRWYLSALKRRDIFNR